MACGVLWGPAAELLLTNWARSTAAAACTYGNAHSRDLGLLERPGEPILHGQSSRAMGFKPEICDECSFATGRGGVHGGSGERREEIVVQQCCEAHTEQKVALVVAAAWQWLPLRLSCRVCMRHTLALPCHEQYCTTGALDVVAA